MSLFGYQKLVVQERESEFVQWNNEAALKQQVIYSFIGSFLLLLYLFVIGPHLFPEMFESIEMALISAGLIVVYSLWTLSVYKAHKGRPFPFVRKYNEFIFTGGCIAVTLLYSAFVSKMEVVHGYWHVNFLTVVYLCSFIFNYSRLPFMVFYSVVGTMISIQCLDSLGIVDRYANGVTFFGIMYGSIGCLGVFICYTREMASRHHFNLSQELHSEKEQSMELLANILPRSIISRFQNSHKRIADHYNCVSVLFADLVGFTELSKNNEAEVVVGILDRIFTEFDEHCTRLNVEKIKTIGDAYMAASGIPEPVEDHAQRIVYLALEMLSSLDNIKAEYEIDIDMRIGIHSGPVVAGIIGKSKFCFDVWGDTVNVAARLEGVAEKNQILASQSLKDLLPTSFPCRDLEPKKLKGIGLTECCYVLDRRKMNRHLQNEIKEVG